MISQEPTPRGVPRELLEGDDTIPVPTVLVRLVGVTAAVVWGLIWQRSSEDGWWRASCDRIADETGVRVHSAREAVDKLEKGGLIESCEERFGGFNDRVKSYRVLPVEGVNA